MATVTADYQDRKRVVFNTRGREFINVRETAPDGGPTDFSSVELLLIALGNCTLGALLNHELLTDAPVSRAYATLDAQMAKFPTRVEHITVDIELEVGDPDLMQHYETLSVDSCTCPLCNTLAGKVTTTLKMNVVPAAVT
jgi:uncharacterized OsmC-like protein